MAEFSYTAVDAQGALVRGTLEAETEDAVLATLRRQGHIPMRVGAPARFALSAGLGTTTILGAIG
ncbi:type II secretion system protein GspF, partial [Nguyenibacter vanlangensis]|nr:type II secretion system protein GspF [Nguyenibacter vanlangensis]